MRLLVCGDRRWDDEEMVATILKGWIWKYGASTLIHGAAPGADSIAGEFATNNGWTVEAHPADWNKHGKAAGPIRNAEMIRAKPDHVIAFHDDLASSKGTGDMVRKAKRAKLGVWVVGHG